MSKNPKYKNQIPILSIILPTFNRGKYILDAIESIQAMSFKDWELIIVDDGSVDQTNIAISKCLVDERIHYFYNETNQGASFARNLGLQKSTGKYISYLDSDNTYTSSFMSPAIEFLEKNQNFDLVYGALLTSSHGKKKQILFKEFSRRQLLKGNYIDMSTIVHRRKLYELFGGFDESIHRLDDWDLILKYTQNNDAKGLEIVAANYRTLDDLRVTDNHLLGANYVKVLSKWPPRNINVSPLKVLYVLNSYPQLSESYVEYELKKMCDFGFEIEVWRRQKPHSPYHSDIKIHDEDLREVVSKIKPDLIHIHWLDIAKIILPFIDDLNIPTTIRAHSFDTTKKSIKFCTKRSFVKKIYCFPQHFDDFNDAKLKIQNTVFDTKVFKPHKNKNKRLVVRGGAALPSKSLPFFILLAKELPDFKFILAVVKCHDNDDYINELKKLASSISSPVEIRTNLSRESYTELVSEAGIFLHTVEKKLMNVGMPTSISEAMATGCYVVASNNESMKRYIGESGKTYNDMSEAKKIIKDTELWSDHEWDKTWKNSAERAFSKHADETILRPMFFDWIDFEKKKNQPRIIKDLKIQIIYQSKKIANSFRQIGRLLRGKIRRK